MSEIMCARGILMDLDVLDVLFRFAFVTHGVKWDIKIIAERNIDPYLSYLSACLQHSHLRRLGFMVVMLPAGSY